MASGSNEETFATSEEWRQVLANGHMGLNTLRRVLRNLPSAPRCKVCNNPFGGIGGKICKYIGMVPSRKNPNICAMCCEDMPRGGAEVDAVILFADVRNSTKIAERLGPTEYSNALNRFYSAATDVLIRHDAVIDKLIGDEVMAFFVPGHAGKNFKRVAVRAARKLMRRTGQYNNTIPELPIGIGMESGIAFAGNIGANNIIDFTVVGDPVNVAARIQSAAKPGEILIGSRIYDSVKASYEDCESRKLKVKGKEKALQVYSIPA
jgi:adenylate cyclase